MLLLHAQKNFKTISFKMCIINLSETQFLMTLLSTMSIDYIW